MRIPHPAWRAAATLAAGRARRTVTEEASELAAGRKAHLDLLRASW